MLAPRVASPNPLIVGLILIWLQNVEFNFNSNDVFNGINAPSRMTVLCLRKLSTWLQMTQDVILETQKSHFFNKCIVIKFTRKGFMQN